MYIVVLLENSPRASRECAVFGTHGHPAGQAPPAKEGTFAAKFEAIFKLYNYSFRLDKVLRRFLQIIYSFVFSRKFSTFILPLLTLKQRAFPLPEKRGRTSSTPVHVRIV